MNSTRLTPLGRLVAMVALLTCGAVAGAAGAAATRPHAREWRCVLIRPGDTLWGMASAGGDDTRASVHRIVEHNALGPGPIQPGSSIWVPTELASDSPTSQACTG